MDTCIHMNESLRCSPGTITTLFMGYTLVQKKKKLKRKKKVPLPKTITTSFMGCTPVQKKVQKEGKKEVTTVSSADLGFPSKLL